MSVQGDSAGRGCGPCKNLAGILAERLSCAAKSLIENDLAECRRSERFCDQLRQLHRTIGRPRSPASRQPEQREEHDRQLNERQSGGMRVPAECRLRGSWRRGIDRHAGGGQGSRLPHGNPFPTLLGAAPTIVGDGGQRRVPTRAQQAESDRGDYEGCKCQPSNVVIGPSGHGPGSAGANRCFALAIGSLKRRFDAGNTRQARCPAQSTG